MHTPAKLAVVYLVFCAIASAQVDPPVKHGEAPFDDTDVVIVDVSFSGVTQLAPTAFERIVKRYQNRTLKASALDESVKELEQRIRDIYQQHGFFVVLVRTRVQDVAKTPNQREVQIRVAIEEGLQYRLKELHWSKNTVVPTAELDAAMPLKPGDVFDTDKVRKGLENLRRLYGALGHINFTPIPDTKINHAEQSITLTMDLDEGKPFLINRVEFLGLREDIREKLVSNWRLPAGAPYNTSYVEQFFTEHQSLLPSGARPERNVETIRNEKNSTVDLFFDFSE